MTAETEPASAADVDRALVDVRQGDVVAVDAIGWIGDPAVPLTPQMRAADSTSTADEASFVSVSTEAVVVVSQTCDVVRPCADRPLVTVAHVVHLDSGLAVESRRGYRPRYAHVPALGNDAFADLDVLMTVEKSIVAAGNATRGCEDEREARRFAQQVGRKFARVAFPDDLVASLGPLVDRIKRKHDRDSFEGRALAALSEIRVTGNPSWSASSIDVFLTFAPRTRADAHSVGNDAEWDECVDSWISRCRPRGVVNAVDGAMLPLSDLTALEYVDSDGLDLNHLS